jgi:peptidyl-prolyl cis-trans isomerase D
MAAITTTLRNRAGLLIGAIAIAVLGFLLMDVFSGNNGLFTGRDNSIGSINGEKVEIETYERKLEEARESQRKQSGNQNIDEQAEQQIRDQVWSQSIYQKLMTKEYENLGVAVGEDELYDMVQGKNVHPQITQAFTDPATKQFNRAKVVDFVKNLDKADAQQPGTKKQWLDFENYIVQDRMQNKYTALITKGMYVSKSAAEQNYADQNKKSDVQLVLLQYLDIADSTIKVTDDELKAQYNQDLALYQQDEEVRKVEYVLFSAAASAADTLKIRNKIIATKAELATTADADAFATNNSDLPVQTAYTTRAKMTSVVADTLFKQATGSVYGPYIEGNHYKITKVADKTLRADSVKARHILLDTRNGKYTLEAANKKADSLMAQIKTSGNFDALARTNSDDVGSGAKGGDLGRFAEGMMVKPFNDACFDGKTGDLVKVESQFGVHIIEIMENNKNKESVKFTTIAYKIEPFKDTFQEAFNQATQFRADNNTPEALEKTIKEKGLNKRIAEVVKANDAALNNLPQSRQIVRWAYNSTKGSVSEVFDLGEGYAIATLSAINAKGYKPLDDVKKQVEAAVIKTKKAEILTKKMNDAIALSKTLPATATALKTQVRDVKDVAFGAAFIPTVGREPKLLGGIASAKPNVVATVQGEMGVFAYQVVRTTDAGKAPNIKEAQKAMEQNIVSRMQGRVFDIIKKNANVQDTRYKFY